MSETKEREYLYLPSGGGGFRNVSAFGDEPLLRYRLEKHADGNEIMVYDPEPVEPTINEERWAFQHASGAWVVYSDDLNGMDKARQYRRVRLLDKATWDEHEHKWQAMVEEAEDRANELANQIATLERQLAEAKAEKPWGFRAGINPECGLPDPSSAAPEAWMEAAAEAYFTADRAHGWRSDFLAALRRHAPRERYPEVADFLDAFDGNNWSLGKCLQNDERHVCRAVGVVAGNRTTTFGCSLSEAAGKLLDMHRAALESAKGANDG